MNRSRQPIKATHDVRPPAHTYTYTADIWSMCSVTAVRETRPRLSGRRHDARVSREPGPVLGGEGVGGTTDRRDVTLV